MQGIKELKMIEDELIKNIKKLYSLKHIESTSRNNIYFALDGFTINNILKQKRTIQNDLITYSKIIKHPAFKQYYNKFIQWSKNHPKEISLMKKSDSFNDTDYMSNYNEVYLELLNEVLNYYSKLPLPNKHDDPRLMKIKIDKKDLISHLNTFYQIFELQENYPYLNEVLNNNNIKLYYNSNTYHNNSFYIENEDKPITFCNKTDNIFDYYHLAINTINTLQLYYTKHEIDNANFKDIGANFFGFLFINNYIAGQYPLEVNKLNTIINNHMIMLAHRIKDSLQCEKLDELSCKAIYDTQKLLNIIIAKILIEQPIDYQLIDTLITKIPKPTTNYNFINVSYEDIYECLGLPQNEIYSYIKEKQSFKTMSLT